MTDPAVAGDIVLPLKPGGLEYGRAGALLPLLLVLALCLTQESLNPITRFTGLTLACMLALALCVRWSMSRDRLTISTLTPAMGLLILYAVISLPRSPLPIYAVDRMASLLLGGLVLLLVQISLQRGLRPEAWENALLVAASVMTGLSALVVVFWYREWALVTGSLVPLPPIGFRLPGILFGHPNVMAGFLNLLLPLAWVRLFWQRTWRARAAYLFLVLAFAAVEYFASSRGGWLGAAAGLAVTTFLIAWAPGRTFLRSQWRLHRTRSLAIVVGVLLGTALLALGGYALFSAQAAQTYHAPASTARAAIWGPAVSIIQRTPILGSGPASFVVRFAQATGTPPGFSTNHAHNLILQLAAEGGAIALLLSLVVTAIGLWALLPGVRRSLGVADPSLAAALGAFTALFVQHTVDYLFNVTPYLLAVMILAGLTLAKRGTRGALSLPARALGITSIVLAVAAVAAAAPSLAGASTYLKGVQAARMSDWAEVPPALCAAAEGSPDISVYHFECGLALARQAASQAEPQPDLDAALREQQAGMLLDPTWPVHRANLAALEWAAGDRERALEDMRLASNQAPRHAMLAVNLGRMLEDAGHAEEAIQAYGRAFDGDPLLLDAPYFAATEVRRSALLGYRPALPLNASDGLVNEARQALQASESDRALQLLTGAIQANVRNARAFAWRAWALADLGQAEAAWRDIQTAAFVDPTATEALAVSALVAQRLDRGSEALELARRTVSSLENASESTAYYAELYRRPYLPFDLVPQLIRALPTSEVLQALELAALSYEQRGQAEEARAVRAWMVIE